jgi:hypothetical protein
MSAAGPTAEVSRTAAIDPELPDAAPETGRSTTEEATLKLTHDRYSRGSNISLTNFHI